MLSRQKAIEDKVRKSGKLRRFSKDIRLMFSMLRDYWQGNYREVPWKSIAAIAGALIYVLNPLDLIPDLLLGIGFLDDAGVVAACLALVETDLLRYAAWKERIQETEATTMQSPR
ncbi:MAG: YkvA family protein [Marinobacter sp.]